MIQKFDLALCGHTLAVYADNEAEIVRTLHAPLHKHGYGELHFLLQGAAAFQVEGVEWLLRAGEALYIPRGCFHSNRETQMPLQHLAFPVDAEPVTPFRKPFSRERLLQLCPGLCGSATQPFRTEDIHGLLFLLADLFFPAPVPDRTLPQEAAIDRFISRHYPEPLTVQDLAAALHLSEAQTQRVMRRVTGKPFLAYLTDYRMEIAAHLRATTSLSLQEIAQRVGYRSYPGFYKARQKRSRADAQNR